MSRPLSLTTRLLHTSLPHRSPAKTARDVLAAGIKRATAGSGSGSNNSTNSSPTAGQSSSEGQSMSMSETNDSVRQIFASLAASRPAVEVDETRRLFRAGTTAPPSSFLQSSLHPAPRPFPRQPLLGPPRKIATRLDPFHLTSSSPLEHDLNPLFALAFVNPMGKIKGRNETGLTWKNQRRVGKLVRRARAMGLVSRWSNQPVPGGIASGRFY